MSLRVAFTSAFTWPEVSRGGERYVHELAAALTRRGHTVRILSTAPRPDRDTVMGVPVRRLKRRTWLAPTGRGFAAEMSFGPQALVALAAAPIDVWHAVTISDAAAATHVARVRPGLRTVYTDLGFPARASRERRPDHAAFQRVVRDIDVYACLSEPVATHLRSDYDRDPEVVGAGVDLTAFEPAARDPRPTLLFASSLDEERKNAPMLVAAAGRLLDEHPDLQVWLLGPGDATALLADLPDRVRAAVTRVELVDRDQLARDYARAWVTVLPSRAEAFGLVALESLAAGTPAVVLQGGGAEGIVTPETGVAVTEDVDALVDGLRAALDRSREADVVEACRERARDFDWDTAIAARFEDLYLGGAR